MPTPRYIDTHAHLDDTIYARDLDIVVKHALEEGVWMVTVGTDLPSSIRAVQLAERYPEGVYAAVGIHPRKVEGGELAADKLVDMDRFNELASHPKVVAIGEVGLDYHDLPDSPREDPNLEAADRIRANQQKVFGAFLELSRRHRLPMLLHCREAHAQMLDLLEVWDRTNPGFDARGIVHCFSGTWKDARRYYNLDLLVSLTGIITHGAFQAEVIRRSPASRLVVESDCPYLTPVPWSIRRNEPAYLPTTVDALAGIRGVPAAQMAKETTENALRTFRKMMLR